MKKEQIAQALRIHSISYALLRWIDANAKRDQQWLDDQHVGTYRASDSCEKWLNRNRSTLPSDFRPDAAETRLVAHLLSSYFETSFEVHESGQLWNECLGTWDVPVQRRLISRALAPGSGKPKRFKERHRAKEEERVKRLKLLALEGLAQELDLALLSDELHAVASRPDLQLQLGLWSYAWELVRRTEFASQGPAVHRLWLELPDEMRKDLTAESIWNARAELAFALQESAR